MPPLFLLPDATPADYAIAFRFWRYDASPERYAAFIF